MHPRTDTAQVSAKTCLMLHSHIIQRHGNFNCPYTCLSQRRTQQRVSEHYGNRLVCSATWLTLSHVNNVPSRGHISKHPSTFSADDSPSVLPGAFAVQTYLGGRHAEPSLPPLQTCCHKPQPILTHTYHLRLLTTEPFPFATAQNSTASQCLRRQGGKQPAAEARTMSATPLYGSPLPTQCSSTTAESYQLCQQARRIKYGVSAFTPSTTCISACPTPVSPSLSRNYNQNTDTLSPCTTYCTTSFPVLETQPVKLPAPQHCPS